MSYDLYFQILATKPATEELAAHFSGRPNYSVQGTEAYYANEDTGVYFVFDWTPSDTEAFEDDPDSIQYDVSFNMNYCRPSFFGMEAAPELGAFLDRFPSRVNDPQVDGMREGSSFSDEGFKQGWDAGNLFGVKALTRQGRAGQDATCLTRERLHSIWRWNFNRKQIQQAVGEGIFVPIIMPMQHVGGIHTIAVWGDLIPIVLPQVDLVLAPLSKHKGLLDRKGAVRVVPFQILQPFLASYVGSEEPVRHWHIEYAVPPKALLKCIRSCQKAPREMEIISWDMVIDRELLKRARE
ncbi:MAG: hypothetical protein IPK87_12725 [Planctomycetes bacterium]|nr:hypothetical protein [Planctomycetota bacterium]